MSSLVHIDNKRKNVLIIGEGPTQGLYNTLLKALRQPRQKFWPKILTPYFLQQPLPTCSKIVL